MLWFYAKIIATILEYKNTNSAINKYVSKNNKTKYEEIKRYSKYKYNIQDHAIFINEAGMYELTLKSSKSTADKFRFWISNTKIK